MDSKGRHNIISVPIHCVFLISFDGRQLSLSPLQCTFFGILCNKLFYSFSRDTCTCRNYLYNSLSGTGF